MLLEACALCITALSTKPMLIVVMEGLQQSNLQLLFITLSPLRLQIQSTEWMMGTDRKHCVGFA